MSNLYSLDLSSVPWPKVTSALISQNRYAGHFLAGSNRGDVVLFTGDPVSHRAFSFYSFPVPTQEASSSKL